MMYQGPKMCVSANAAHRFRLRQMHCFGAKIKQELAYKIAPRLSVFVKERPPSVMSVYVLGRYVILTISDVSYTFYNSPILQPFLKF